MKASRLNMFILSRFQLFPFWVILSIVVHVYCNNDSRIWFSYGNSSIEYVNHSSTIDGAAPTVAELPVTVAFGLAGLEDLLDPVPQSVTAGPELLSLPVDEDVPYEHDFSTIPDAVDPASLIQAQDSLAFLLNPLGWDNEPSSWEAYEESLSHEEDVLRPLDVTGIDTPDSTANGEVRPHNAPWGESPGHVVPLIEDVHRNLHPSSPQSAEEETSSGGSGDESPRAPQRRQDLAYRWIAHQRRNFRTTRPWHELPRRRDATGDGIADSSDDDDDDDEPPPRKKAASGNGTIDDNRGRPKKKLWTPGDEISLWKRKFWASDEENPRPKRSRLLGGLGTAAVKAASLALFSEAERRRKQENSARSDDNPPTRKKLWNPGEGQHTETTVQKLLLQKPFVNARKRLELHRVRRAKLEERLAILRIKVSGTRLLIQETREALAELRGKLQDATDSLSAANDLFVLHGNDRATLLLFSEQVRDFKDEIKTTGYQYGDFQNRLKREIRELEQAEGDKKNYTTAGLLSPPPFRLSRPTDLSLIRSDQHQKSTKEFDIISQLESCPVSQEQFEAEIRSIYARLFMAEAKCIEADKQQVAPTQADSGTQPQLDDTQWQSLAALHKSLINDHHDFLLASQHPSASPALRRLAHEYAMPARMWRHAIHSFLELLKHRLPVSLDHMLAFIYMAYSMMALLYETVPAFEDTWIECLGDLGRYRLAIEDDDVRDREVWTGVARYWYSKSSERPFNTGQLYHHLAILARPSAIQLNYQEAKNLPSLDTALVGAHGVPRQVGSAEVLDFELSDEKAENRHRALQFCNLANDIHQKIAGFLSHEQLLQLTLSCRKLHVAYRRPLTESLEIGQQQRARELHEQWTTRATLALPLDEEEILETMGTRMSKVVDSLHSPHSCMTGPSETMDDWLFSFMHLEFDAADENVGKTEPLLSLAPVHQAIAPKQLNCNAPSYFDLLHTPNDWMVMLSEEETHQILSDDEKSCNGEVTNIDEEDEAKTSAPSDAISTFGTATNRMSVHTQVYEKNVLHFRPPSMTDGSTTIKYSPDSKPTPSTSGDLTSPKTGTRLYRCPQCKYSCQRMCDLRKHSRYHTKDFHCSMPTCQRSFSRKQDLVRHEKGPHQNGSEEHYCPHAECRAKNQKPFTRKDNLMKHLRNKHSKDKLENNEQKAQGELKDQEEQEVEDEQNRKGKNAKDRPPGSDA